MRAVCWCGTKEVHVETVPDPKILNPRDAIIRVSLTAICGSDLHLYNGCIDGMEKGDILGHEFMGEVVEVGDGVQNLRVGSRVVVPFTISCGQCLPCSQELFALCDNSNPQPLRAERAFGYCGAGIFGYSHLLGGYAGGQAEYVRVPYADVGPIEVPPEVSDEQALFLSDILPTGYMATENANIRPGDTVAVWGCGPVGLMAMKCAQMLGAERVVAIDRYPERLRLAADACGADTINFEDDAEVFDRLRAMTGGRGPDACIDAVGMEAHGPTSEGLLDRLKSAGLAPTDRAHALRQAIHACRKGGTVSIPGVYAGSIDRFPIGQAFAKNLTLRMGQTHVQKYMRPLLERIVDGEIDPSFVISHRTTLEDAPKMYREFSENRDACSKVVMRPS